MIISKSSFIFLNSTFWLWKKLTNKLDLYAIRCHGRVRNLHLVPNNSYNNDSCLVEFHVFDFVRHALKMSTLQIRRAKNNSAFSDNECYTYSCLRQWGDFLSEQYHLTACVRMEVLLLQLSGNTSCVWKGKNYKSYLTRFGKISVKETRN